MPMGEVMTATGSVMLKDIVSFPIWWYTRGIIYMFERLLFSARRQAAFFAVNLWVRNVFVPMYGQYDWQGRIISFFIRLIQIVFRSLAYIFWLGILAGVAIFYVFAPIVLVVFIFLHADLLL
jgi:hypothetical protein